ncbi:MAG: AraC family transcriptional regulator [Taibaiella sp.]|nr:AraC family transcriptional regulator [Taibaiella sp.]
MLPVEIYLGGVVLPSGIDEAKLEELDELLRKSGMSILSNPTDVLTDSIKMHAWNFVHFPEDPVVKFSVYLVQKMGYTYNYLSNVFSDVEGMSVTAFLNALKVELARDMILGGRSFKEIARKLNYANLSHLSFLFKKATGETMSQYKKGTAESRPFEK